MSKVGELRNGHGVPVSLSQPRRGAHPPPSKYKGSANSEQTLLTTSARSTLSGHYYGYVMSGSKVVATCHHAHKSLRLANTCSKKMKRDFLRKHNTPSSLRSALR